jgi:hypothetical protein
MGEVTYADKILVGEAQVYRLIRRFRDKWENNIKMGLAEKGS